MENHKEEVEIRFTPVMVFSFLTILALTILINIFSGTGGSQNSKSLIEIKNSGAKAAITMCPVVTSTEGIADGTGSSHGNGSDNTTAINAAETEAITTAKVGAENKCLDKLSHQACEKYNLSCHTNGDSSVTSNAQLISCIGTDYNRTTTYQRDKNGSWTPAVQGLTYMDFFCTAHGTASCAKPCGEPRIQQH